MKMEKLESIEIIAFFKKSSGTILLNYVENSGPILLLERSIGTILIVVLSRNDKSRHGLSQ